MVIVIGCRVRSSLGMQYRIVSMFLDLAGDMARGDNPMTMKD